MLTRTVDHVTVVKETEWYGEWGCQCRNQPCRATLEVKKGNYGNPGFPYVVTITEANGHISTIEMNSCGISMVANTIQELLRQEEES